MLFRTVFRLNPTSEINSYTTDQLCSLFPLSFLLEPGQSTVTLKGYRKPLLVAKQRILKLLSEDKPVPKNPDYIKRTKGVAEYLVALSEEVSVSFPDYWENVSCSDLSVSKCDYCDVVEGSPAYAAIEALVMYTWDFKLVGAGLDARGLTHSEIFIKKISRIENAYLYTKYQFQLKALAKKAACKPFSTVSDFLAEPEIRTTKFAGYVVFFSSIS